MVTSAKLCVLIGTFFKISPGALPLYQFSCFLHIPISRSGPHAKIKSPSHRDP